MAQHSRRTTFAAGAVSFVVQHELWDGNVDDHSDQGVTILVTAPVQDCLERAYNRGLPLRLRGKDPQTVRRFVENSHAVALLAGNALTSKGSSVIKVDNSLGLEQSITALYRQIAETPMFQKYFIKQYQTAFS